jgi:hypothetical protein
MTTDNSSNQDPRNAQDSRDAIEQDRALQADPELDLSGGRASAIQIALVMIGSFAIIMLVLYGLNSQHDETAANEPSQTATQAPPAAQTPGQPAASAGTQNAPQTGTTGSGAKAKPEAPAAAGSNQQGAPAQGK